VLQKHVFAKNNENTKWIHLGFAMSDCQKNTFSVFSERCTYFDM